MSYGTPVIVNDGRGPAISRRGAAAVVSNGRSSGRTFRSTRGTSVPTTLFSSRVPSSPVIVTTPTTPLIVTHPARTRGYVYMPKNESCLYRFFKLLITFFGLLR